MKGQSGVSNIKCHLSCFIHSLTAHSSDYTSGTGQQRYNLRYPVIQEHWPLCNLNCNPIKLLSTKLGHSAQNLQYIVGNQ